MVVLDSLSLVSCSNKHPPPTQKLPTTKVYFLLTLDAHCRSHALFASGSKLKEHIPYLRHPGLIAEEKELWQKHTLAVKASPGR